MAHTSTDDYERNPFEVELLASDLQGFLNDDISFLLRQLGSDRIRRVVTGLQWEDVTEEPRTQPAASFRLSRAAAQSLMDRLYSLGLRPKEAAYFNPALVATKEHLEDMRAIAFAKTGVTPPTRDR